MKCHSTSCCEYCTTNRDLHVAAAATVVCMYSTNTLLMTCVFSMHTCATYAPRMCHACRLAAFFVSAFVLAWSTVRDSFVSRMQPITAVGAALFGKAL
jgi:hypothetical protein